MGWIIFLLVLGLLLICLEIFVPGGIVGTMGGIALITSVVLGFTQKGNAFGMWWLLGTLSLTLFFIYLAVKFFPRSPAGKKLFLQTSESGFSSHDEGVSDLIGKEGKALTSLRPSGIADIDGRRIDVLTDGEFLPKGARVHVVKIEGNRVVVRAVESKQ